MRSRSLGILEQKAPPTAWVLVSGVVSRSGIIEPDERYFALVADQAQAQQYADVENITALLVDFPLDRIVGNGRVCGNGLVAYRFIASGAEQILQTVKPKNRTGGIWDD